MSLQTPTPRPTMPFRLRDLPSLPLLALLHLLFTTSSLLLRLYELLQTPPPRPSSRAKVKPPPKHVALALQPRTGTEEAVSASASVSLESVRSAVRWAGAKGVGELSVWDGCGQCLAPQAIEEAETQERSFDITGSSHGNFQSSRPHHRVPGQSPHPQTSIHPCVNPPECPASNLIPGPGPRGVAVVHRAYQLPSRQSASSPPLSVRGTRWPSLSVLRL